MSAEDLLMIGRQTPESAAMQADINRAIADTEKLSRLSDGEAVETVHSDQGPMSSAR